MDCAPGTVFSVSRRICDVEANVLKEDRCNNGVYSSEYDYTYSKIQNKIFQYLFAKKYQTFYFLKIFYLNNMKIAKNLNACLMENFKNNIVTLKLLSFSNRSCQ